MGAVVKRNHVFSVDMNAVRGDSVGALLTHTADPISAQLFPPVPGDVVEVVEHEGDRFLATVDVVDGIWVGLTIDWDTCVPALPTPLSYGRAVHHLRDKTGTRGDFHTSAA